MQLFQVEVIHMWESLPEEYTLMDVAYIYTWKRVSVVSGRNVPSVKVIRTLCTAFSKMSLP
jgi:hypothetical protein